MSNALKKLVEMLKGEQKKSSGTDYTARVTRVEGGTAYVQLTGAEINDTPVTMSINANIGDEVRVRVADGKAWITGNDTAPPTDDTVALEVTEEVKKTNIIVRSVKTALDGVKKIADDTNQYFWMVSEGTDTGAHITEVPKETFLNDPENGGGNLLARSNGVAVRDGLIELATFSSDGLDVYSYNSDGSQVEIAHLGYGEGTASSGTSTAPYFTFGKRYTGSAIGNFSIVAGNRCTASGFTTYAEGYESVSSGHVSHAEGYQTESSGFFTHSEGHETKASSANSHAEGYLTVASSFAAHAGGIGTIASKDAQTAIGKYNVEDTTTVDNTGSYGLIVGNGTDANSRSNAFTIDWSGNVYAAGTVTQSSDRRLKDHKEYLDNDAVEFIRKLKPAHYIHNKSDHVGFYAQDVAEADPWGCMTEEVNGYLTLGYTEIIAPLVKYCQQLEARIEALEKEGR